MEPGGNRRRGPARARRLRRRGLPVRRHYRPVGPLPARLIPRHARPVARRSPPGLLPPGPVDSADHAFPFRHGRDSRQSRRVPARPGHRLANRRRPRRFAPRQGPDGNTHGRRRLRHPRLLPRNRGGPGRRASRGWRRVRFAGVVPTPAVAHLVKALGADAGISVSASHNAWPDNGIKLFSWEGKKLPDAVEASIGRLIATAAAVAAGRDAGRPVPRRPLRDPPRGHASGPPRRPPDRRRLRERSRLPRRPGGVPAGRRRGDPARGLADGQNINERCGALHPTLMAKAVVAAGADFGLALDGDADRAMLADGEGRILDGDDVLLLWALELEREGKKPASVVGTVMSNWGLEEALAARGIALVRAAVGDRYVVEEMDRLGVLLGGEQSGHLIRADLTTTGDGTLTGLHVAASVAATGVPLATGPRLVRAPQVLVNVEVRERIPFESIPGFAGLMTGAEERIAGSGRILVRYSGTELLARVMVEGVEREGPSSRSPASWQASSAGPSACRTEG
ncbi:MAG: hypothetical protein IPP07_22270 [Holophagales bacterium]|nr:hypothetical protein [Holophagales bacterium]